MNAPHLDVGQAVRDSTTDDVPPHRHLVQRSRFLNAIGTPRRTPWGAASLAVALVVVAVAGWFVWRDKHEALEFESQIDATTGETRWLFSDGSQVQLAPGGAATVVAMQGGGAKIDLARGRLDVYVNPAPHAKWEVLAGPHTVTVTGTKFLVERGAQESDVTVEVTNGRVLVGGPELATPVVLDEPGERYSTVAEPEPEIIRQASRPPPPRREPPKQLAFEDELLEAERARLAGEKGLAEEILTRMRGRYPNGPKGSQVAFRLGRLLEYDKPVKAAAWYARVMKEQPESPLARSAAQAIVDKLSETPQAEVARRFLAEPSPSSP